MWYQTVVALRGVLYPIFSLRMGRRVARVGLARDLDDAATHNLLRSADPFLKSTLNEGSSLAALEAIRALAPGTQVRR